MGKNTFIKESNKHREPSKRPPRQADIEDCEEFWPWLKDWLADVDQRDFNRILVDYAEWVLSDPGPYGDGELNYAIKGRFSFLGHALRKSGKKQKPESIAPHSWS